MAKRRVSRKVYLCSNIVFYSLCLSGLIWQVTQISVNYFEFDVIRDIEVIMPEQIIKTDEVLNLCFDNYKILHYKTLKRLADASKLPFDYDRDSPVQRQIRDLTLQRTIKERFEIALDRGSVFNINSSFHIDPFIFGPKFCYQVSNPDQFTVLFDGIFKGIAISCGEKLSYFDHRRLFIMNSFIFSSVRSYKFDVRNHFYSMRRLPWPYIENCKNYEIDQFREITNCVNKLSFSNSSLLYQYRAFRLSSQFINHSISFDEQEDYEQTCGKSISQIDCHQHVYPTTSTVITVPRGGKGNMTFNVRHAADPSFVIQSKARIDDIDYVTYILGALGSWLGFSFIGINPIPYSLQIEGSDTQASTHSQCQRKISRLETKISVQNADNLSEKKKTKDEIREMRGLINSLMEGMTNRESN